MTGTWIKTKMTIQFRQKLFMRYLLTPLVVLVSVLLTSCLPPVFPFYEAARLINPPTRTMFEGEVRNLDDVGQIEEVEYYISRQGSTPLGGGRVLYLWYFHEPDITLLISITDYSRERAVYNTDSEGVSVKLVKGEYPWNTTDVAQSDQMDRVRSHRGVTLKGSFVFHKHEMGEHREFDLDIASKESGGASFRGVVRERVFRG